MRFTRIFLSSLLAIAAAESPAQTEFTYQGELLNGASVGSGLYDFRFVLYNLDVGGIQQGNTVCVDDVQVANGRFTAIVDPGALTPALERWIEIAVRDGAVGDCSNTGAFTTLSPRQRVTPAPSALYSAAAATASDSMMLNGQLPAFYRNAGNLNAGTLGPGLLSGTYGNALTFNNAANAFSGSGSGLTGLNATNIASGTLADARLSTNIPRLNAGNIFSGSNRFNGSLGIGTVPAYALDVFTNGVQPARVRSDSVGGTWFGIQNDSAGGINWDLLSAGSTNGEGAGSLVFRAGGAVQAPRMTIKSAGNVGIGTISPSERLHVAGNLRVDGTIAIPAATRTLVLGSGDFVPSWPGSWNIDVSRLHNVESFFLEFLAGVHLPDLAVITGFVLIAGDNSPSLDISASLLRMSSDGEGAPSTLAAVTSSGAAAGPRTFASGPMSHAVSNNGWRYVARLYWADGANLMSVRSVAISYTIASLP